MARGSVAAAVGAVLAVVCCAAGPALGAAVGGLALAEILRVGTGIVLLGALGVVAVVVLRARRRRASEAGGRRR